MDNENFRGAHQLDGEEKKAGNHESDDEDEFEDFY